MNIKVSAPRSEYPRPQMVRKEWLNLNGKWKFDIDYSLSGEEKGYWGKEDKNFPKEILVPFCPESELSGIGEKDFMPCVWYQRSFVLPKEWKDKRILLHFGAVDYGATVWVNGEQVGTHRGGYSPFSFEITHLLKNEENHIVVRAVDDTRSSLQPSGKQSAKLESHGCHYTRTTGIWQTVWLEAVPSTYLLSFRLHPDLDQGKLTIHASVDGNSEGFILNTKVFVSGKKVGEANTSVLGGILVRQMRKLLDTETGQERRKNS